MPSLFDYAESRRHMETGVAIAAENSAAMLVKAKAIAIEIGRQKRFVNADDVARRLTVAERKALGNGAGSVFKGREWRFANLWVNSTRINAHARGIRVWEYVGG